MVLVTSGRCRGAGIPALAAALFVVAILFSLLSGGLVTATNGTTEISVSVPSSVAAGSAFTALVAVNRIDNFDAGNYDLSFNPAVLALENVTAGQIGSVQVPVELWNRRSPGKYTIVQNVPGLAGISGAGSLAVLHFRVVGPAGQSSTLGLSNGILSNNLAEAIAATWGSSAVQVVSGLTSSQRTPPTPPSSPGAGTIQPPPAASNATPAAAQPSLPLPPDTKPSGSAEIVSESHRSAVVSSPSEAVPAAPLDLAPGPQTSEKQETARAASTAADGAPPVPSLAARLKIQPNMVVIWGALSGVVFILGVLASLLTTRRRSR